MKNIVYYFICIKLYSVFMYIVQPIVWLRLLWISRKKPCYRKRWLERYGFCSQIIKPGGIVIHAVSLGEMILSISLVRRLQRRYLNKSIVLTAMTPTAMQLAESICSSYNNVYCQYLPYDLPGAMRRFVCRVHPKLVISIETELWPNFINVLHQRKIPFIVVNARMSLRSFIRYKNISSFIALMMEQITLIVVQHKKYVQRFFKLGCRKDKLCVMDNLKFDIEVNQDVSKEILFLKSNWIKGRRVWIAGSTHSGEEMLLLQAHKQLLQIFPTLLLIVAPRHLERCSIIQKIVKRFGLSFIMKSSGLIPTQEIQVVINDVIGNLMTLYGISDIAFVGGSLVKHGGHNLLEPAIYAIPVLVGPYTFNFFDICCKLRDAGGLITVVDVCSIVRTISMLLQDRERYMNYGSCAAKVFKKNQGASQQLLNLLGKFC